MHSCDPPDVEEATAFPSEEDDAIREWRQEFPEQTRRAISRIHTNLGHPQNFDARKDDLFNDTLLDVHYWNYQGREVLVFSQTSHHNQRETCMK